MQGHSDADVLTHALIDALLGAAALGDIGDHFPDTDQRCEGADSIELLREASRARGRARLAGRERRRDRDRERPRLGPHEQAMAARLAGALGVAAAGVNVKATTNEGMGFIGRGEGIAAIAVAHDRAGGVMATSRSASTTR